MANLAEHTDVHDLAGLAVHSIDLCIAGNGLKLNPSAKEAIEHALEAILRLAEVELRPDCLAIEEAMAEAA